MAEADRRRVGRDPAPLVRAEPIGAEPSRLLVPMVRVLGMPAELVDALDDPATAAETGDGVAAPGPAVVDAANPQTSQ